MSVVFILASFYFARATGASFGAAWLSSVLAGLYFSVVKWTVFAGAMVDIYAYPLLLLAFLALLRNHFYVCLAVCSVGLFFKEFLLLPLLTQAAALVWRNRRQPFGLVAKPLCLTVAALVVCFLLPRILIHVASTFQDIDPLNNPSSLRLLVLYPLSLKRDFNIIFVYLACWLPVLLLFNAQRMRILWMRLRPHRLILGLYLGLHFFLVMYGGTNLEVFVTYALPVELWVLAILLDEGRVQLWEKLLTTAAVIFFNRLWMHIPLPQQDMNAYLNFYGGYHTYVTWRSLGRMTELVVWIALFWSLRHWFSIRQPGFRVTEPR